MAIPTPVVHWTMDTSSVVAGKYQPTPNKSDDNLTITGTVPTVTGFLGEGASFTKTIANRLSAVGTGTNYRIEELDVINHSFSFWMKANTAGASIQAVLSNCVYAGGSGSSNNSGSWVVIGTNGKLRSEYYVLHNEPYLDSNGNNWNSYAIGASSATTVPLGEWLFITATFGARTCDLYINGVKDCTVDSTQTQRRVATDAKFSIGCNQFAGSNFYPFDGVIDEIKGWNSYLTAAQVLELYYSYVTPVSSFAIGNSGNLFSHTLHFKNSGETGNSSSSWSG